MLSILFICLYSDQFVRIGLLHINICSNCRLYSLYTVICFCWPSTFFVAAVQEIFVIFPEAVPRMRPLSKLVCFSLKFFGQKYLNTQIQIQICIFISIVVAVAVSWFFKCSWVMSVLFYPNFFGSLFERDKSIYAAHKYPVRGRKLPEPK